MLPIRKLILQDQKKTLKTRDLPKRKDTVSKTFWTLDLLIHSGNLKRKEVTILGGVIEQMPDKEMLDGELITGVFHQKSENN